MKNGVVPLIVLVDCQGFENHTIVSEIREKMEASLASEDCRHGYAMHETGHYMYFMEAGYKTFNFRTSRIICSNGQFNSYMASVEVVRDAIDPVGWHQTMDEVVLGYAKALAAGGEFTRLLAPKIHPGDEKDRIVFDEQCEAWQKTGSIIDADAYWSSARKAVRLRLQDHDFRAKAIQECRFVYSKLFPWVNGVG